MTERRQKRTKRFKSGFALPLVASIMVVLLLMGTSMLSLGQHARIRSIRTTSDIGARTAADAGLAKAFFLLNKKAIDEISWNNDVLPSIEEVQTLPNSSEAYSFNITGNPGTEFTIVSTGWSGLAERKVYATTRMRGIYDFAVAVKQNLVLYPNSKVNGYNSKSGVSDLKVDIGTNGVGGDSVIVMNGATVNGDVYIGPGGDPEIVIKNSGEITGNTYPMSMEVYFPLVDPLTGLAYKGFIKSDATIGPTDSGEFSYIALGNSEVVTIDGGDVVMYVTGDIDMGNGAEIIIEPGSSLTMYVDGNWESKEGSGINNLDGIPGNCTIYGTGEPGQTIDLKAKNEFYATVYAPDAVVGIKAGGDIYGSFTAQDFELKTVNYDTELSNKDIDDEGIYFAVSSWREE
ncbi:MAG: DUF7305 domain-containing protein [Planctomycetota bacterium]|jgi:hypothetical protein